MLLALAGHGLLLDWLASQWLQPAPLVPMVAPLYTRTLHPQTGAPPVAQTRAVRPKAPSARVKSPQPGPALTSQPEATTPTVALGDATAPPQPDKVAVVDAPAATQALPAPAEAPATADTAVAASSESTDPIPITDTAAEPATLPDPVAPNATPPAPGASATVTIADPRWPPATRLNYRLQGWFRGELLGDARVSWQQRDNQYEVRVDIDIGLLVSLTMTSQGRIAPEGLYPLRYEETRRGRRRQLALNTQQITLEDGRTLPRPPGVQDTASQFVDLAWRFGQGITPLTVGEPVRFWMARPGGVDLWTYDVVALQRLALPRLGEVDAFHLKPRPIANPRGNVSAEMWFAPTLQYLPVRIRIQQGPEIWLDLLVESIEQR